MPSLAEILQGVSNVAVATGTGLQGGNVLAVLQVQKQQREKDELQDLLNMSAVQIKANPKKYYEIIRDFHIEKGNMNESMQATQALAQFREAEKGQKPEEAGMAIADRERARKLYTPGSAMYKDAMRIHNQDINKKLAQSGSQGVSALIAEGNLQRKSADEQLKEQKALETKMTQDKHFTHAMTALRSGNLAEYQHHAILSGMKKSDVQKTIDRGTTEFKQFYHAMKEIFPQLTFGQAEYLMRERDDTRWKQRKDLEFQKSAALKNIPQKRMDVTQRTTGVVTSFVKALDFNKILERDINSVIAAVNPDATGIRGVAIGTIGSLKALGNELIGREIPEDQYNMQYQMLQSKLEMLSFQVATAFQEGKVSNEDKEAFQKAIGEAKAAASAAELKLKLNGIKDLVKNRIEHYEDELSRGGNVTKRKAPKDTRSTAEKEATWQATYSQCMANAANLTGRDYMKAVEACLNQVKELHEKP